MAVHGVDRGGGGGGGVSDGDKGDIVISGSGAVYDIDAGVVTATELASNAVTTAKILDANVTTAKVADANITLAKLADLANARVIGRNTAGTGVPESITMAQLQVLLNAAAGVTYSFVKINSTQTFATATPANVTGMIMPVVSGHIYKFKVTSVVQTDTNTVGIQHGLTTPTFTRFAAQADSFQTVDATGAVWHGRLNSSGDTSIPTAAPAANQDQTQIITGLITPTADGNLQLQMATETGTTVVSHFVGIFELWDYGT